MFLLRLLGYDKARVYDGSSEVQQMVIAHQLRKGNVQTAW